VPVDPLPPGRAAKHGLKQDIIIESVYKIFLMAYYSCASDFIQNPMDLGYFYMDFEAIMKGNDIQFRWLDLRDKTAYALTAGYVCMYVIYRI
jgi:hypothetical protein